MNISDSCKSISLVIYCLGVTSAWSFWTSCLALRDRKGRCGSPPLVQTVKRFSSVSSAGGCWDASLAVTCALTNTPNPHLLPFPPSLDPVNIWFPAEEVTAVRCGNKRGQVRMALCCDGDAKNRQSFPKCLWMLPMFLSQARTASLFMFLVTQHPQRRHAVCGRSFG